MKNITSLAQILALCLLSSALQAAGVNIELSVHKLLLEQNSDGQQVETLVSPNIVIPGDTMVYVARVANSDASTAENIKVITPIPAETTFLPGSTVGADQVTYSVDGGKNFDSPERLQVLDRDNKPRAALPGDYTHIRWLIPSLAPNSDSNVRFQARVNEE